MFHVHFLTKWSQREGKVYVSIAVLDFWRKRQHEFGYIVKLIRVFRSLQHRLELIYAPISKFNNRLLRIQMNELHMKKTSNWVKLIFSMCSIIDQRIYVWRVICMHSNYMLDKSLNFYAFKPIIQRNNWFGKGTSFIIFHGGNV